MHSQPIKFTVSMRQKHVILFKSNERLIWSFRYIFQYVKKGGKGLRMDECTKLTGVKGGRPITETNGKSCSWVKESGDYWSFTEQECCHISQVRKLEISLMLMKERKSVAILCPRVFLFFKKHIFCEEKIVDAAAYQVDGGNSC